MNRDVDTLCRDKNPDAVCMKHTNTLSNERRNINTTSANNGNSKKKSKQNNTTDIVGDIYKFVCMFDK